MKKQLTLTILSTLFLLATTPSIGQVYSYLPDTSFDVDGIKNFNFYNNIDRLYGVVMQPDGKPVMAGLSRNPSTGFFELCVTRLQLNGAFDSTFNGNGFQRISMGNQGSIGGMTPKIQIAPDGKFVLVNSGFPASGNAEDIMICRLDSNGVLDPTFNGTGVLFVDMTNTGNSPDRANDLDVATDGSIWVAGVTRVGGTPLDNEFAVVKVQPNGQLDPSFNGTGKKLFSPTSFAEFGMGIRIQDDGKIVLGGDAGGNMHVLRFDSTGVLDNTFNGSGSLSVAFSSFSDMAAMELDSIGRIIVTGKLSSGNSNVAVARILTDGTFDPNFGTGGKYTYGVGSSSSTITSMYVQPDMKIMIGGFTSTTSGAQDFMVTRVDTAGVIDLSFNNTGFVTQAASSGAVNDECNGLAVMNDGRIVLTGTLVLSSAINEDVGVVRLVPVLASGTGLSENQTQLPMQAAPNPFHDELTIVSRVDGRAVMMDAQGRLIMSMHIFNGINRINTTPLAAGIYFLQVPNAGTLKVVKQ